MHGSVLRLTGRPAVLVLLTGVFVSAVGDSVATIAFSLYAASIASTGFLSALLIADALPIILLGLWGGVITDRLLRWWWWPLALTGQAGVFAMMAVTSQQRLIVALMFASSTMTALMGPVSRKLLHHHAGENTRGAGRDLATTIGVAAAIGVALGTVSFGASSTSELLAVNAASFLFLALASLFVSSPGALSLNTSPARGVLLGFRLMASPHVFGVAGIVLIAATVLSTSLEDVAGVFVLLIHTQMDPWQYGLGLILWSFGVVAGTRLIQRLLPNSTHGLVAGPLLMGSVFLIVALLLPPWWTVCVLYLLGGLANGGFNAALNSTMLSQIPAHQQGRAWAALGWIIKTCLLAGYLISGLSGQEHATTIMATSGILTLSVGLAAALHRSGHATTG